MYDIYTELASLLMDVEVSLRTLGLWSDETPSLAALASKQPFACDSLRFEQWVQFIFLPRLAHLIECQMPLPEECGVAPMAEEYFKTLAVNAQTLISQLRRVDRLITEYNPA